MLATFRPISRPFAQCRDRSPDVATIRPISRAQLAPTEEAAQSVDRCDEVIQILFFCSILHRFRKDLLMFLRNSVKGFL